jgi:beta-lactamase superfamily II metal-dependent hydrolase
MRLQLLLFFALTVITAYGQDKADDKQLQAWTKGMLDIHFINTGRGNASFLVFPDGTTMLIDAGDMNAAESEKVNYPLKVSPALPNDSQRPGQWIAAYIKQ